jgi:hypothetical protein
MPREPVHRSRREPELDPDTPTLEPIENDLIKIDPNKWFRKSYALDFGMAHTEIPVVLEQINDAIQRAAIAAADAKKDAEQLAGLKLMKLRQDWSNLYQDKMTEATLTAVMDQDEGLYQAWHRYSVLKSWVGRLENMMENLRLKLGAMRSFEATRRKTMDDENV